MSVAKLLQKRMFEEEEKLSDSSGDENLDLKDKNHPDNQLSAFAEPTNKEWKNRSRTLIVCSRGVNHRQRHITEDLHNLLPHSKKESKIDKKGAKEDIAELCFSNTCNMCMFLEAKSRRDLYMWLAKTNVGPSIKFQVQNLVTS